MVGYARVSTAEQSMKMQIEALQKAGVRLDSIHQEHVSGAASRRPKLEWALKTLRPGDTFTVWKMDRMARSLVDLLKRMDQIKAEGAQFKSLTEEIDTNTPGGRLVFHVLGAIAEFERDLIRERTNAGVKAAMARGVKFGQPPALNPKQIKQAQVLRDKGTSVRTIAKQFKVSHATIYAWTRGPGQRRKRR
jgi:DNA invertase Pin-like site-specific DNA recombinase